jgi:hypothetical protein
MAIMEGRDAQMRPISDQAVTWIGLYGIDLARHRVRGAAAERRVLHRPGAGLGIEVEIAEGSALLKNDHIYGFETREEKEGVNG